jgi:hypothetical protein
MEESEDDRTYVEIVDGVQLESGLKSQHLITDRDKQRIVRTNARSPEKAQSTPQQRQQNY